MNFYNKTILLVEDEAINARLSKRALEKYGYRVIHATSGEEAVTIIKSTPEIDLALMDIDLGDGIDGTEAAEIILENRDIPLVFLSSHTEPEIVKKTEEITSYGYIVKNSGDTILMASMKMAFRLFEARKKEEENERRLTESEMYYRSIFEYTGTSMFIVENDMTIVMVNDEFIHRFGYSREEVVGIMKWPEIIHPDSLEFMKEQHRLRRVNEKEAWQGYELKYITRTGETRFAFITVGMIPGTERSIASITDLNDQKNAEMVIINKNEELAAMNEEFEAANEELIQIISQLEEREDEYRVLLETSSSGVYIVSEGKLSIFNHSVVDITGYPEDELLSKPLISFIHPDDVEMVIEHYNSIIRNKDIEINTPMRILSPDNKIRWIGLKSRFIKWGGKKATLNFISDITARKEAEESLIIAEETYRDLFMNSQVGIFRTETDTGMVVEANDYFAQLLGYRNRDDMLAEPVCVKGWYADSGEREKIIDILKEKGELKNYDARFRRDNGPVIWLRYSARLLPETGWMQGVLVDITELKNTQDALRISENKYRRIFENVQDVVYQVDLSGTIIEVSPSIETFSGYKRSELIGTSVLDIYHNPLERERFLKNDFR